MRARLIPTGCYGIRLFTFTIYLYIIGKNPYKKTGRTLLLGLLITTQARSARKPFVSKGFRALVSR